MKLDDFGSHHQFIAAAAGSIVGLYAVPGDTLRSRLANILAGFVIAIFAGPALIEYLGITSLRVSAGIVFIVGSTGLVVFDAVVEAVKKMDIAEWIRGWLPGRKGGQ